MSFKYLKEDINLDKLNLQDSNSMNHFLIKNNSAEIVKAINFLNSDDKFLYIHGFLGTGKRQFINYITEFIDNNVIILEYYCKASTVCDDILLDFINILENKAISKTINLNTKITTLTVKLEQFITSIQKPYIIILHSFDNISAENQKLIINYLEQICENSNIKFIASTRAMTPEIFGEIKVDKKIFLKALTKEIFKEFISFNNIQATNTVIDDFYKYTRGYYYYVALAIKVITTTQISLHDFLTKFGQSGMNFDSFLRFVCNNTIPPAMKNFFWFMLTVRHGLSINTLAIFELYNEALLEYLKNNLVIFQVGEIIYVQDYFQEDQNLAIPTQTEIKLHKYIISLYEQQLKEPVQKREITISRQAFRAEIEYHTQRIYELENGKKLQEEKEHHKENETPNNIHRDNPNKNPITINEKLEIAKVLSEKNKLTEAIELYTEISNSPEIDERSLVEIRTTIARLYKKAGNFKIAQHYFELVEHFYNKNKEYINLNYLYYEISDLYFLMYKHKRAIETIEKVIYSVDTPQSLMVSACTRLGNIYSHLNKPDDAIKYYQKAIESIDEKTEKSTKSELYFKYALTFDDKGDEKNAFLYYSKCIDNNDNSPYVALAYANMGSCYFENRNFTDAKDYLLKAYEIDKKNNNYDGIYYSSSYLAKIAIIEKSQKALEYLIESKQCAEFMNENFYILKSTLALGDYYYNNKTLCAKGLIEYFKAKKIAQTLGNSVDINIIEARIQDMKLRMSPDEFKEIETKYEQ